jgi:Ca2+-binding RTX toxin-like protein
MKKVATVVALGALRICTDNPNDLFGTNGDGKGQDTLFGLGAGGELAGRSAADRLAGSLGADRLEGNDGNDTPDGGIGEDRIFTGGGFDFVYVRDGDRDYVNCNGQTNYRIIFDENLDRLERCPGANSDARVRATKAGGMAVSVQ